MKRRFIVITGHAWFNEHGDGVYYLSDMRTHPTAARAATASVRRLGHDDFLIGELDPSGILIGLTFSDQTKLFDWTDEDYQGVANSLSLPARITEREPA